MNLSIIPNLLTLANLMSGMIGILIIIQKSCSSLDINNKTTLSFASFFIFLGAFFDFLDGFVARLLKVESKIGANLDALADLVTFGILPSIILMKLSLIGKTEYYNNIIDLMDVSILIPLSIPLFTAYRLARFNAKQGSDDYFEGLSSTATGIFVGFLAISGNSTSSKFVEALIYDPHIINPVSIALSLLMISDIQFVSFKFKNFNINENLLRFCLVLTFTILFSIFNSSGGLISLIIYIVIGILNKTWHVLKNFFADF